MSSWWDNKLNNKATVSRPSAPVTTNHILPALQQQARAVVQASEQARPIPDADGKVDMGTALRSWKGGEAQRLDGGLSCPRCGSKNVFSRANASAGGNVPAPRCFECGWNGLYEQADQISWSA